VVALDSPQKQRIKGLVKLIGGNSKGQVLEISEGDRGGGLSMKERIVETLL
jgi:hypothetical protein